MGDWEIGRLGNLPTSQSPNLNRHFCLTWQTKVDYTIGTAHSGLENRVAKSTPLPSTSAAHLTTFHFGPYWVKHDKYYYPLSFTEGFFLAPQPQAFISNVSNFLENNQ